MQPSKSPAMVNGSRTYSVTRIQILLWSRWRLLPIGAWRVLSSSWLPSCSVFLLPVPMHRWRTRVSLATMLSVLIKLSGVFHLHLILFGCSQRSDAENIINALIGSVSNLAVSGGQINLGWEADTSARFSDRPVPRLKRNSLFAELLYRIVYRDSLRIGICRNCGAPFLQSGIGSLNDVCSQACRMTQRRRKGLA